MLLAVPRDVSGNTQGFWLAVPRDAGDVPRGAGSSIQQCYQWWSCPWGCAGRILFCSLIFCCVFFFFPLGLMSTSGSLSLSVFSSLLPLEANG